MSRVFSKLSIKVLNLQGYPPRDSPYRMLIIGETGAGKTSFVNLFCNCATVQQYDAEGLGRFKRFNDLKLERAEARKMESKTSGTKVYDVQLNDLNIELIDTPGFGDSRGMREDKENVKKIIAALEEQDYINCVCLIINGRVAVMSATLKYVMSEITAILPKQILNNIIIVFSNTADPLDLNFDHTVLSTDFGLNTKHIFCIENPYCRLERARQKQGMLPADVIATSLKKSFQDTAGVIHDMYTAMKDFKNVHTELFITLYETKRKIERRVLKLVTSYDNQQSLEEKLEDTQEKVAAALRTKELNENFTCVQTVHRVIIVKTQRHNTLCGSKNCYTNCHLECNLPKTMDKENLRRCAAMKSDMENCSKCGHKYSVHYHDEVKFEEKTEEQNFIDETMRKQFNTAQSQEELARIMKFGLMERLENTKAEKKRLANELRSVMEKFYELGMTRNYAKLIETQILVIDTRIEGSIGCENEELRKTKHELEDKLRVVMKELN